MRAAFQRTVSNRVVDINVTEDDPLPVNATLTGGGTTVKATAAAPTYVEGSTTNPLSTDLSGALRVSGGGGGQQYAEDAAHTSGDLGTLALGVRKDTAASLAGTDGDYTAPIFDASGRQHVNVGASALPTGAATAAAQATAQTSLDTIATAAADTTTPVPVVGLTVNPSANFNRPADTTAYASGDLVANSTTAGSVAAMSWTVARAAAGSCMVRRARLKKSAVSITNASFRLHLYAADPAASTGISNGDNGAWLTKHAGYLGYIDITVDRVFSDSSAGSGAPAVGSDINVVCGAGLTVIYGLLEARGAYTPASAETFTTILEVLEN